jgi:hypothetical protein
MLFARYASIAILPLLFSSSALGCSMAGCMNNGDETDGRFSFEGVASGTYVLHIEGGAAGERSYDATDQLIRLDDTATRSFLVLKRRDAGAGSCGGTELELRKD